MNNQLSVSDVILWLETIQRAHGPHVPLWVVYAHPEACDPAYIAPTTMAPLAEMRLETTAGTPAVLVLGAGAELPPADPADDMLCRYCGEPECDDSCTGAILGQQDLRQHEE